METTACRQCGTPFGEGDLDRELGAARCSRCHALTDLKRGSTTDGVRERGPIPLPEKFQVEHQGGALAITWRWRTWGHFFLLFFCALWDSFLVAWYAIIASQWQPATAEATPGVSPNTGLLVMLVFPIVHVAVGIGLTYATFAGLLNRTTLTIEAGELRIRHRPLPWRGNRVIARDELEQLFCEEHRQRTKHGVSITYRLFAILRHEHRRVALLKNLKDANQALYLEQTVERALGIRDEPVAGELPRAG